jgi:hypothetical protein
MRVSTQTHTRARATYTYTLEHVPSVTKVLNNTHAVTYVLEHLQNKGQRECLKEQRRAMCDSEVHVACLNTYTCSARCNVRFWKQKKEAMKWIVIDGGKERCSDRPSGRNEVAPRFSSILTSSHVNSEVRGTG